METLLFVDVVIENFLVSNIRLVIIDFIGGRNHKFEIREALFNGRHWWIETKHLTVVSPVPIGVTTDAGSCNCTSGPFFGQIP